MLETQHFSPAFYLEMSAWPIKFWQQGKKKHVNSMRVIQYKGIEN